MFKQPYKTHGGSATKRMGALNSQRSAQGGSARLLHSQSAALHHIHSYHRTVIGMVDFGIYATATNSNASSLEFDINSGPDIMTNMWLKVGLPGLSAALGRETYVSNFRVDSRGTKPARQDLLTAYSQYGRSESNAAGSQVITDSNIDSTTLLNRNAARAAWRASALGAAPAMDKNAVQALAMYVFQQAGGAIMEVVSDSGSVTDGYYTLDYESALVAAPNAVEGYALGISSNGMTFLHAQRQLWAAYLVDGTAALANLPLTDGKTTGAVPAYAADGLRPPPYGTKKPAGRVEPTMEEIRNVAAYVVAYHVSRYAGGEMAANDQGFLTLADTQLSQFDDLNIDDFWVPSSNAECSARWCNGVGYRMIQSAQFTLGTQVMQECTGDYIFIRQELENVAGRRSREHVLYMPGEPRTGFRNFLTTFSQRKVRIQLNPLTDLIVVNHKRVMVFWGAGRSGGLQEVLGSDSEYSNMDFALLTEDYYLQEMDRNILSGHVHLLGLDVSTIPKEQRASDPYINREIIEQVIYFNRKVTTGETIQDILLPNNCIVKWFAWFFRRNDARAAGDYYSLLGPDESDPMVEFQYKLNENLRVGGLDFPPLFFRSLIPQTFFNSIPSAPIYVWSFASSPLQVNVNSGCVNTSRANSIKVNFSLQPGQPDCVFHLFTVIINMLQFHDSAAAVVYNIAPGSHST